MKHLAILLTACMAVGCLKATDIFIPKAPTISADKAVKAISKGNEDMEDGEYAKAVEHYNLGINQLAKHIKKEPGKQCAYPYAVMDNPVYLSCMKFLAIALYNRARAHALLGEKGKALQNLYRLMRIKRLNDFDPASEADFSSLHGDPMFKRLTQ